MFRGDGAKFAVNELIAVNKMPAASWWLMFGGEVALLQSLAVRVLSQPNTSSECERCFSLFGAVNRKNRRCMSVKQLGKIVTVANSMHSARWAEKQKEVTNTVLLQIVSGRVNAPASRVLLGPTSTTGASSSAAPMPMDAIFGDFDRELAIFRAECMDTEITEDLEVERATLMDLEFLQVDEEDLGIVGVDDEDEQVEGEDPLAAHEEPQAVENDEVEGEGEAWRPVDRELGDEEFMEQTSN